MGRVFEARWVTRGGARGKFRSRCTRIGAGQGKGRLGRRAGPARPWIGGSLPTRARCDKQSRQMQNTGTLYTQCSVSLVRSLVYRSGDCNVLIIYKKRHGTAHKMN